MVLTWRTGVGAAVVALAAPLVAFLPATSHAVPPSLDRSESPLPTGRGVGNVAHKGASIVAPENTLAAVRQAVAQRSNFVGIDVRRTRDGHLVLLHDARLRRTTNVEEVFPGRRNWRVERFTLAQVQRLDAGSWLSPEYSRERVPTLRQALKELRASDTGAFLEIKQPDRYGGVDGVGRQVVRELRRYTSWLDADGPKRRLVLQAFNDGFLKAFEARYDNVVVGTLGSARRLDDYAAWADQINVHQRDVTTDLVDRAHAADLRVSTYVVNRRTNMRRVVSAGVDAISTDRPKRLRDVLRAQSRLMHVDDARPVPAEPTPATLDATARSRALLQTRVPVVARVRGRDGTRARWTWVRVQLRTDRGWRNLQRRATNRLGNLRTTVTARHRTRLRVVTERTDWHRAADPVVRTVDTRRARTRVRLYGDRRLRGSRSTRLNVRWVAEDGRRVSGRVKLWARPRDRRWRVIRDTRITDGTHRFRVRPRRNTRYQINARRGPWWTGDRDRHFIDYIR